MKRLSIITTLYNSAQYLPKCLDSLLCQDIPESDYEIIVVNDGSPDNSEEIAYEYTLKSRIIKIISQDNKGLAGARNTGIRAAEGKYLYFVDPDDYILDNSLKVVLDKMESEDLDVLRFGYTEVDENYQPTKSCKHPESPDYSSRLLDGYSFMAERLGTACYVWTFLFRTALLKGNSIYFYEGEYFDDTPWLPRVLTQAKRVDSIDIKRHFYLIRNDSLVQSGSNKSLVRKKEGQKFLIKELSRQRRSCQSVNADKWYQMMIAHCVLTLLSIVGCSFVDERKQCIAELKEEKVFPLSLYRASKTNKVKMTMINIFPNLFCLIMKARS